MTGSPAHAAEEDRVCTPEYLGSPRLGRNGSAAAASSFGSGPVATARWRHGGRAREGEVDAAAPSASHSMSASLARSSTIVPEIDLAASRKQRHGWSAPWLPGLWLMPDGGLFGELPAPSSLLMSLQLRFEAGALLPCHLLPFLPLPHPHPSIFPASTRKSLSSYVLCFACIAIGTGGFEQRQPNRKRSPARRSHTLARFRLGCMVGLEVIARLAS